MAKAARALQNITLTLDQPTAAWLRLQAAKLGVSVSRLMGDFIHERMGETQAYGEAMRQFLSVKPFQFRSVRGAQQIREEVHERALLPRELQERADDPGESK
jgi:hypothetical protein